MTIYIVIRQRVLHSFFIKNIFYDKMNLGFFIFDWRFNSNEGISLTTRNHGIILFNFLRLNIRSVDCLSLSQSLKQPSEVSA